jgi:uncharacterized protein (TIGR01777 family)
MNILITGGTGLIGRALCKALIAAGHDLTVLSRKPQSVASKCGSNVKAMQSLNEWHQDTVFDAVINLAGEPIIDKAWTNKRKQILWDSRVTLTEQLIKRIELAKHKPTVLLSGSAIGYYGNTGDNLINESSPTNTDFGSVLCAAWENAALIATHYNVRVCLLRTGLVLDNSGGLLAKMLLPFKLGLGARLANGNQLMSWIHIEDYIGLVLLLLANEQASGAVNMTAPAPVTNKVFTQQLAKALHRPSVFITPAWLLQLILGERAYLLLGGQRALPNKARELGYEFKYPSIESAFNALKL